MTSDPLAEGKAPLYASAEAIKALGKAVLWKVDETTHSVYGMATAELPDSDGEIADYYDTSAQYTIWGEATAQVTRAAGQAISYGNIRYQHTTTIGGEVNQMDFNGDLKSIYLLTQPVNDDMWRQLAEGFLTGYSHAGKYAYRRCAVCATDIPAGRFCPMCHKTVYVRYAPILTEVSYVDRPCLAQARFEYVKLNGERELRKFARKEVSMDARALRELAKVSKHLKTTAGHCAMLRKGAISRGDTDAASCFGGMSDELNGASQSFDQAGQLLTPESSGVPSTPAFNPQTGNGAGNKSASAADQAVADEFFGRLYGPSYVPAQARKLAWDITNKPSANPSDYKAISKMFDDDK